MRTRFAAVALIAVSALIAGCNPAGTYKVAVSDRGGGTYGVDVTGPGGSGHGTWVVAPETTTPATTTAATTATTRPTTATQTTATAATTPAAPPPGGTGTAAARFGWGNPLPSSDEFNGATIDLTKWGLPGECWPANDTVVAGRCASHNSIGGGTFKETGTSDGKTGYLSQKTSLGSKYGRTEIRLRITTTGTGRHFHPVLLKWPDSDTWPSGGELDFFEVDGGDTRATAYMHHPTSSGVVQDEYHSGPVDLSQWHNYGFEWSRSALVGYIDGVEWFRDTDPAAQPPGPMFQTVQLDNFEGTSGMQATVMEVDYARFFAAP